MEQKISLNMNSEIFEFLQESRQQCEQEWIYHCTNKNSLKSIICNKEFYIKNLKYVNDAEEEKSIDVEDYRNTFFVGCFSASIVDTPEHREEYAYNGQSVVIAMKKEWFTREIRFLFNGDGEWTDIFGDYFRIFDSYESGLQFQQSELNKGMLLYPFYIDEMNFYKVKYDDYDEKTIKQDVTVNIMGEQKGYTYLPQLAGIIKKKSGISMRTHKLRNWYLEDEIRLKACIHQINHISNGNEVHDSSIIPIDFALGQVIVKLSKDAFDSVNIYFPDDFIDKDGYMEDLKWDIEGVKINVMDCCGMK